MTVFSDLCGLVVPRFCAGCREPGQVLCPDCRALFCHVLVRSAPTGLIACGAVFSCASYEGPARSAILRWKDHGDAEAGRLLARLLCRLGRAVIPAVPGLRVAVVPVPSSHRSVRRRGRAHILELTRPFVRDLRRRGLTARQIRAIGMSGRPGKSVAHSHERQRQARSRTVFRLCRVAGRLDPGEAVILVDDICTTGSTLLACAHVLTEAGHRPVAALTLASVADPARPGASSQVPAFHRDVFG